MQVPIESTKYVLLQDNYDAIMTALPSDIQEMQRAIWPSSFMTNLINPKSQPKGNLYSLARIRAPIMSMDMFIMPPQKWKQNRGGTHGSGKQGGKRDKQRR